jgi:hypothetical protein
MELSKEEEIKKAKEILDLASKLYLKYKPVYKWISAEEAMKILGFKSKTSLQKLRDSNEIVISNLSSKHILYDITSIEDYIERKSNRKDVIK